MDGEERVKVCYRLGGSGFRVQGVETRVQAV